MMSLTTYLLAVLMGSSISLGGLQVPAPMISESAFTREAQAEAIYIDYINAERASRGLNGLSVNSHLTDAARAHCREMAALDYFDHTSPTPELRSPLKRYLKALGYQPSYACVSENLYYCSMFDPARGHRALMNSPSHRNNILSEKYLEVGVGCYVSEDGKFWVTQMFLRRTKEQTRTAFGQENIVNTLNPRPQGL